MDTDNIANSRVLLQSKMDTGWFLSLHTVLLETNGDHAYHKRWSEKRGTNAAAADGKYVYIIPNDWSVSGVQLLRIKVSDGSFAPFIRNDAEFPMPYPLTELFEASAEELPDVTALTAAGGFLLARCSDHTIRKIDAESGTQLCIYNLEPDCSEETHRFSLEHGNTPKRSGVYSMASDGEQVWYIADDDIYRIELCDGTVARACFENLGKPMCMTADKEGNIYIADDAFAQIVKYTKSGQELLCIGKPGGRSRQGKYDRDGLFDITSIAVDSSGMIWAAEGGNKPRRISVWNPDGSFCREFIGNAGYAGQGAFIHSHDPAKACAELNELAFDPVTGLWEVENVMYNPDPACGLAITPGHSDFDSGNMFYSSASGEKKEYFAVLGMQRTSSFFMMQKDGDCWKPTAAIMSVVVWYHFWTKV